MTNKNLLYKKIKLNSKIKKKTQKSTNQKRKEKKLRINLTKRYKEIKKKQEKIFATHIINKELVSRIC